MRSIDERGEGAAPSAAARRVVAHLDADAFYASVHLLEDPSLAGKPVIVAGSGARSIVTTASYEARRFGIGSAQPAARARLLCPHGVFLEPDFSLYRAYSRRAMAVMEQACDVFEPLSLDEAYLDLTAIDAPVRRMRELVARIEAETGLRYSVGIGPNKLCAKVLSDHGKPRAFNVASREQCCVGFAGHPTRLLPGIGPRTADALEGMGLRTVGDLQDADPDVLVAAFGPRRGAELHARSQFRHEDSVRRSRPTRSMSEESTFSVDIDDAEELERRLRDLADELCDRLVARDLRGRTIGIKVRLEDFTTITRSATIDDHVNSIDAVWPLAVQMLRDYAPPRPVRLLGVRVASFEHDVAEHASDREDGAQQRIPGHAW